MLVLLQRFLPGHRLLQLRTAHHSSHGELRGVPSAQHAHTALPHNHQLSTHLGAHPYAICATRPHLITPLFIHPHNRPVCRPQVNGQRLQHGTDNFWAWNPGAPIDPSAPLTVALASGRQAVRARVPALRSADLGVQFRPA